MFNIQSYLAKFKNIGQEERLQKEAISSSIKEVSNIEIELKNIFVKNGEVNLKISPAMKNTIFIKKDIILAKIKEKGDFRIIDLR